MALIVFGRNAACVDVLSDVVVVIIVVVIVGVAGVFLLRSVVEEEALEVKVELGVVVVVVVVVVNEGAVGVDGDVDVDDDDNDDGWAVLVAWLEGVRKCCCAAGVVGCVVYDEAVEGRRVSGVRYWFCCARGGGGEEAPVVEAAVAADDGGRCTENGRLKFSDEPRE